jgi:flagellar hook assembly protein FlgD
MTLIRSFLLVFLVVLLPIAALAQNFWQQTGGPGQPTGVAALVSHPDGSLFAGTSGNGVFKSTNNGGSWQAWNSGIGSLTILSLAVSPDGTVLAGTQVGLFILPNQSTSWGQTSLSGISVLTVAARSSNEAYAGVGNFGVHKSTNGGFSWFPTPLDVGTITSLAFSGLTGPVFAGSTTGVARSTDGGSTWVQVNNGLTNTNISAVAVNTNGDVYAGTVTAGVFKTTNNGTLWVSSSSGISDPNISTLRTNSQSHILAGTRGGVFRSMNHGASWAGINAGLADLTVLSMVLNSQGVLFAGGNAGFVFRSRESTIASFRVTNPNGGENWQIGSTQTIQWTSLNVINAVRVELSRNGGATYTNIADSIPNTGSINYNVVGPPTTQALVRVGSYIDNALNDPSDNSFIISLPPSITVLSPNGGENWQIGTTQLIQWNSVNVTGRVKIEVSRNGGTTYSVITDSTDNTGTFNWVVTAPATTQGRVRISSVVNPQVNDVSDNNFTISDPPSITVVSPNGGENWQIGTTQLIQWNSVNVTGRVKIEVSRNGGTTYSVVTDSTDNTGIFNWVVTAPATTQGRVRISSVVNPQVNDVSDNNFTISSPPSITVVSPNGGENWQIGTTQLIQWNSVNVTGRVKIEVSRNGGTTYSVITDSTDNTGTFNWAVTAPATTQGRVRISSVVNGLVNDVSDGDFIISLSPTINVTVPNGGETWVVGSTQQIAWTSVNVAGKVRIEISRDAGQSFSVITDSTDNTGVYSWPVTGPGTTQARVRVTSILTSSVFDISDANFAIIVPFVTVLRPNGGEVWQIASLDTVRWTSGGTTGNAHIALSRDGGLTFTTLDTTAPNTGRYAWRVTGPATTRARIRISIGQTADTSDNDFFISALSVRAPDTVISGSSPNVVVTPPTGYTPTVGRLFFKNGGQTQYDSVGLTQSGNDFQGNIPPGRINIRGVEYYLFLSNGLFPLTFPDSAADTHPALISVRVNSYQSPTTFERRTYKMISVPLILSDRTPAGVLVDDYGQYNRSRWRLFRFENGVNAEFPAINADFSPGNAFWLITHAGTPFDVDDGLSVDARQPYPISVPPGWSQIANPFAFPVDWDSVMNRASVVGPYEFAQGQFSTIGVTTLRPWEGYFVFNGSSEPVQLGMPNNESISPTISPDWPAGAAYCLKISATIPALNLSDEENIIGFAHEGSSAHRWYPEPPAIDENFVQLSILEDDRNYMISMKEPPTQGAFWDMVLSSSSKDRNVSLQLSHYGEIPQDFGIHVLDMDEEAMIPVEGGRFEVYISRSTVYRRLRVVIGTQEFAKQNSNNISLTPLEYGLSQNYPNPFNPTTTIRFQLGRRSNATLEIFNVLGQRVRVLLREELGSGGHGALWDGTNDAGTSVGSGVYFYRLTAATIAGKAGDVFTATQKLVLVR